MAQRADPDAAWPPPECALRPRWQAAHLPGLAGCGTCAARRRRGHGSGTGCWDSPAQCGAGTCGKVGSSRWGVRGEADRDGGHHGRNKLGEIYILNASEVTHFQGRSLQVISPGTTDRASWRKPARNNLPWLIQIKAFHRQCGIAHLTWLVA